MSQSINNIPPLRGFVELLQELGFDPCGPVQTDKGWTIQLYPAILVTYQDKVISIYYGQEKDPFWRYESPNDKVMLRGAMEVVRKMRREEYQLEWHFRDE